MIIDIKVILSGKECMCTVKELKAFQKELNNLFPIETPTLPLKDSSLNPLKEFYQGKPNISLQ